MLFCYLAINYLILKAIAGIRYEKKYMCVYFICFSVITNIQGTVSITPMENAKTFVNGNLISESSVLHHVSGSKLSFNSSQVQHHAINWIIITSVQQLYCAYLLSAQN